MAVATSEAVRGNGEVLASGITPIRASAPVWPR